MPMRDSDNMIFHVDETSDLPIWAQLRNRVAYLIRTGYFVPGSQLPSVRSLAATVGINYNTVTKAYRDLELSGLIVSVRGRGMFVQKNVITDNEELEAADALFVNCLRQYRACGMSYGNIRDHLVEIVDKSESEAKAAEEERQQYGVV